MRIYTRDAFMALPAGVLFSKGKPWCWDGLCVKGDSIVIEGKPIDFGVRYLIGVASSDCAELVTLYDDMLDNGASHPMEDAYGRDGCFDKDDMFLVWERADLEEMGRVIVEGVRAIDAHNEAAR